MELINAGRPDVRERACPLWEGPHQDRSTNVGSGVMTLGFVHNSEHIERSMQP